MKFHGVHEVALLGSDGLRFGYFNDLDLALRVIEQVPDYKAAWASLNPIRLPAGIPLNPDTLQRRASRADDTDVLFRVSLMVDFDPPRPAETNSTDAEKRAAHDEMERAREYLHGFGWPEPMVCDSGNGWHLRYGIELPNNDGATGLVKAVLEHLKSLFPMVDTTASNASRLCKFYGTMTRKGPHSDERPWRRSAIVADGSDAVLTEQQLKALLPAPPAPAKPDDAKLSRLLEFLERFSVEVRDTPGEIAGGWQVEIACPWAGEHTTGESARGTVVTFIDGQGYGFKCLHGHCDNRHWKEFREKTDPERTFSFGDAGPDVVLGGGGLPLLAHATLAEAFLRDNHDFCAVYDAPGRPVAQWVKTRWDVSGDDTILWRAVADYLKDLHSKYPAPERGPDSRMRLYDATFINGVVRCVKPYLPPVKAEVFDREPYMCGFRSMWAPDSSGCGHRKRSDVGSDYAAMWAGF